MGSEAPFGFESILELNARKMQKNAGSVRGRCRGVNTINEAGYYCEGLTD